MLNWIPIMVVAWGAPTWTGIFCLSLLMTQRPIKRGEIGQSGSHCWSTGVKHDQTTELNRGIIMPKCVSKTEAEREWVALLSYLVTHSLDNAATVSSSLYIKVRFIVCMYEHLFMAHMMTEKQYDLCTPHKNTIKLLTNSALCVNWHYFINHPKAAWGD